MIKDEYIFDTDITIYKVLIEILDRYMYISNMYFECEYMQNIQLLRDKLEVLSKIEGVYSVEQRQLAQTVFIELGRLLPFLKC